MKECQTKKYIPIRLKLFLYLTISVVAIILFLILLNSIVLEKYYLYSKTADLKQIYTQVNNAYITNQTDRAIKGILSDISLNNNFDILLEDENGISIYTSNENVISTVNAMNELTQMDSQNKKDSDNKTIYADKNIQIKKIEEINYQTNNKSKYILLSGILQNNNKLYVRMPVASIEESAKISNNFLCLIGGITLMMAAVIIIFITKIFTDPIKELNEIANRMSNLDFSRKYHAKSDTDDEINSLGCSINRLSSRLEGTINQLKNSNVELEKGIEEKSKIEEMRGQFVSDVSHELKTPIALIQGYAEGLVENVNKDEENRKFYAEVILDEANKMDKLVKQLLELMKLEYGKRDFQNDNFNIVELISEVLRRSKVMLDEKKIKIKFDKNKIFNVYADEFYIEQVVTNYVTNAIKHAEEECKDKYIEIKVYENKKNGKIRVTVFNTGKNIDDENLNRIWKRFYKVDSSRNRNDGGTGIGLSLVKAIMNNYKNDFGVQNKDIGVEFYFELDKAKSE